MPISIRGVSDFNKICARPQRMNALSAQFWSRFGAFRRRLAGA
jgi:hypothetical protein